MDIDINEYNEFQDERTKVFNDIAQFLMMTLTYFEDMEKKRHFRPDVIAANLQGLIKSLCLYHALHGYPANPDTATILIDVNAVRDLVINLRINSDEERKFEYYCKNVLEEWFWQFEFTNGEFTLDGLLREPAYIFLEMVRDLSHNYKEAASFRRAGEISRHFLRNLPHRNKLRPVVWAKRKKNPACFGYSLGVRHFVRPLYLYTKLRQLRPANVENDRLEDVMAFAIKKNDIVKQPCVTCQRFFGFISSPIIGNCAEYDVIGNVHPNLLQTEQGQQFKDACQQHFNAFKTMMQDIHNNVSPEYTLRRYFENTRRPNRPKVLKYQWNSEAKGGFELIALDRWWR